MCLDSLRDEQDTQEQQVHVDMCSLQLLSSILRSIGHPARTLRRLLAFHDMMVGKISPVHLAKLASFLVICFLVLQERSSRLFSRLFSRLVL